jgi:transcriptional regulator with XRE-family HTH domain
MSFVCRSTIFVDNDKFFSYFLGMSPEQSRAARGWLGWSQTELAKRASVSLSTVRDFENAHRVPIANNLDALRRAIEGAGIELLNEEGSPVGIRLSQNAHGIDRINATRGGGANAKR